MCVRAIMALLLLGGHSLGAGEQQTQPSKLVVGYYTNWAQYRSGEASYEPESMNGTLYTHVVYAFATVSWKQLSLKTIEPNDLELYSRLQTHLRKQNPNIKIYLGIGSSPSAQRDCSFRGIKGTLDGLAHLPDTHATAPPPPNSYFKLDQAARTCWTLGASCGGITKQQIDGKDVFQVRKASTPHPSNNPNEVSYVKQCPNNTRWERGSIFFRNKVLSDPPKALKLAQNVAHFASSLGFDGIELHLNTLPSSPPPPSQRNPSRREKGGGGQKQRDSYRSPSSFIQLLESQLEEKGLGLGLAMSNAALREGRGELLGMWKSFEYMILIGYDISGCWQARMSAHSPLYYDNAHDSGEFRHRLGNPNPTSIDEVLTQWISAGVPKSRIILGFGLFGRSWTSSEKDLTIGSSYGWCGSPGQWTREPGLLAYHEVVHLIRLGARTMLDHGSQSLYLTYNSDFVSFEAVMTLQKKIKYLLDKGLAGAALWSADLDDFVNGNILSYFVSTSLGVTQTNAERLKDSSGG